LIKLTSDEVKDGSNRNREVDRLISDVTGMVINDVTTTAAVAVHQ